MRIPTSIFALGLAIVAVGPASAEGEPKSRTECADMKEMIWDDATKTCNPIEKTSTKGPGQTPVSRSPPGQPSNSETSDRTPEKPTPTGSEKDRMTPADPTTKSPRAPDELKK
jgi:hypothetical protein